MHLPIYAGRLGLGQAIFEPSGWSGAWSDSVDNINNRPWFTRGGYAAGRVLDAIEAIHGQHGGVHPVYGFRGAWLIILFDKIKPPDFSRGLDKYVVE